MLILMMLTECVFTNKMARRARRGREKKRRKRETDQNSRHLDAMLWLGGGYANPEGERIGREEMEENDMQRSGGGAQPRERFAAHCKQ